MQLQIKHLTPYLPYRLQFEACDQIHDLTAVIIVDNFNYVKGGTTEGQTFYGRFKLEEVKPLLHPLQNLLDDCPEEIRDEFSEFEFDAFLHKMEFRAVDPISSIPTSAFLKMIELKYDVFRLIPQGLALDINTVVTK